VAPDIWCQNGEAKGVVGKKTAEGKPEVFAEYSQTLFLAYILMWETSTFKHLSSGSSWRIRRRRQEKPLPLLLFKYSCYLNMF
jgi:hypothetical protein